MTTTLRPHYAATLRLGVPIAVGQIGVILMGFADTMMVGHYSTGSLAAASFVNNLFNLVTFLLMGYSYGLTPLISAHCGRGERAEAGACLKNALAVNALYGTLLLSIMAVLYFFLDRMGHPEEILPLVRPYYLVMLISMIFVMAFNVLRQFTDGTADTTTGMWTLLAGNALNIGGNYLLIYGIGPFPELGLLGAGLSTLFARVFSAAMLGGIILARKRYAPFRSGFRAARIRLSEMLHINAKSLPVSIQMGMETGSFTFSAVMAGWLGAVDLASYQVLVTIGTLGFLFYYSFGAGMSIRVATFTGTKDWPGVRQAAWAGCHILVAMAILSSATFLCFGEQLIRVFTSDPEVQAIALTLIGPLVLYQFGDAMQICFANALRGTAHVMPMMGIAFVSYIVVGIPASFVMGFPLGMGIHGIFLAFSIGLFTAATLFFITFRHVVRRQLGAKD